MASESIVFVRDNQTWHANLHSILDETASAPTNLIQHNAFIADLKSQFKPIAHRIRMAEYARQKEFREHESYRDSSLKKFAYKVSGKSDKFELRQDKEEEEYHNSLQDLQNAQAEQENTERLLSEAEQSLPNMQHQAQRHNQADHDLEQLYSAIFSQPDANFPAVEDAKLRVQQTSQELQTVKQTYQTELQSLAALKDIRKKLGVVQDLLLAALRASRADMVGLGGSFADYKERSALDYAKRDLTKVDEMMEDARRVNPRLKPIARVTMAEGNIMSDVFFDNLFSDMAFHDKIEASEFQLNRAVHGLDAQLVETPQMVESAQARIKEMEGAAGTARAEFRMIRKGFFEALAKGERLELASNNPFREQVYKGEEVPPPYQG